MKRRKLLAFAVALMLCGAILCVAGLAVKGFDISAILLSDYEAHELEVTDEFSALSIDETDNDIFIDVSLDGICRIEYEAEDDDGYSVYVEDGVLHVQRDDRRRLFDRFDASFMGDTQLRIYLPVGVNYDVALDSSSGDMNIAESLALGDVYISTSSGGVEMSGASMCELQIFTSSGDVELANVDISGSLAATSSSGDIEMQTVSVRDVGIVTSSGDVDITKLDAQSVSINTSSGDAELENAAISGALDVVTSSGDVELLRSDAETITIETSSGNVYAELLTPKFYSAETDSGSMEVPESDINAGRCYVKTQSGNIMIHQ